MAENEILVGLAGTGFIGPAHLEALRRNNIKIAGLAEATPELAQKKAAELGKLYILQGSYLQDWLLLPTDWNWRLVPEVGGGWVKVFR
jgi:hypothetical protein